MTYKDAVLNYLQSGNTLTAFDGFRLFGITSIRDYVSMLRKEGYKIGDEWRENLDTQKRFKEYFMEVGGGKSAS